MKVLEIARIQKKSNTLATVRSFLYSLAYSKAPPHASALSSCFTGPSLTGTDETLFAIRSVHVPEEEAAKLEKLSPAIDGFQTALDAAESMLIR